jgi:IS6 family transposase
MRGLKRMRWAATITLGHAFVQNLGGGHDELATEQTPCDRLSAAFGELARCL